MNGPTPVTHSFVFSGVQINIYHPNKGEGLPRHEHVYAHSTYCTAGSIVVRKEGREVVMTPASKPVTLVPYEWHEIEALEDGTSFTNVFLEGKY